MVDSAWGASRTKGSYLKAKYNRVAKRRGKKKAIIAVGHKILISTYYIMRDKVTYGEPGEDFFDRKDNSRLKLYFLRRLDDLGYSVSVEQKLAA